MQLPSPVQTIQGFSDRQITLWIKRDDLIHPEFGGNKWRKLKYNLEAFKQGEYTQIITFGGPFSNHVAATASACKFYNIPCTAIIRGQHMDPHNPSLLKARADGMALFHVSKEAYRQKTESAEIQDILANFPDAMILPEGGTNELALKGTGEISIELNKQVPDIDIIITPIGTGGTAAGIIYESRADQYVYVISTMRNPGLEQVLTNLVEAGKSNWKIIQDYHFGGFAKTTESLIQFINQFWIDYNIPLDPVYTGKMFFALQEMLHKGEIDASNKIALIHTGGLQGITAYNYMQSKKEKPLLIEAV